jgi:hypothetical protein
LLTSFATKKRPVQPAFNSNFVAVEEHVRIKEELLSPDFSKKFTNEGIQGENIIVIGRADTLATFENIEEIDERNDLVERADKDGLRRLMDYGEMIWMKKSVRKGRSISNYVKSIHTLNGIKGKYTLYIDFECVSRLLTGPDLGKYLHRECRTIHRFPMELLPNPNKDELY